MTDSLASARACDPNLDDVDVGVNCDVKNFADVVFCDILSELFCDLHLDDLISSLGS